MGWEPHEYLEKSSPIALWRDEFPRDGGFVSHHSLFFRTRSGVSVRGLLLPLDFTLRVTIIGGVLCIQQVAPLEPSEPWLRMSI